VLEFSDLSVRYGVGIEALQGATLSAPAGKITAVIGGNGAGKSTLLRAATGLLGFHGGSVVGGSVSFMGKDLAGLSAPAIVREGLVHVPEGRRMFGDLTVIDNLRAGGASVKSAKKRDTQLKSILELFPLLAERRNQRAGLLSGGQQQILAICRGMMSSPKMILLDEPTLGLAPQTVEHVADVITTINNQGVSVVIVEQNAAMALGIADFGNVVEQGRVVMSDKSSVLRGSPEVQKLFLGGDTSGTTFEARQVQPLERWIP